MPLKRVADVLTGVMPSSALSSSSQTRSGKALRPVLGCTYLLTYLLTYLFMAVLGLHCGARASHCGGFSCCGARALGAWALVVAHGLSSYGSRALEHRLSSCDARA